MAGIPRPAVLWRTAASAALLLISVQSNLAAAEVTISLDKSGRQEVTLDLQAAGLEAILQSLAERFAIAVEWKGEPSASSVSGRYSGRLSAILPRILRGQDFLLIHGPAALDGSDGIARIVILNASARGQGSLTGQRSPEPSPKASQTAAARKTATASSPGKDKDAVGEEREPQGLSAEETETRRLMQRSQAELEGMALRMQQVCVAAGRCKEE